MTIDLIMLLSLSFTVALGFPSYMFFRQRMIREKRKSTYTQKRIIKLTLINIFLTYFVAVQLLTILVGLLLREDFYNAQTVFLAAVFVLTLCLIFYGAGMYITSIVIEAYTDPSLRKRKSFFSQFDATNLFHGPISHILVYGGSVAALFVLSLLDLTRPSMQYSLQTPIIVGLGLLSGGIFGLSQVYNKTYMHQLLLIIIVSCASIVSILFVHQRINVASIPIFSFFLSFCISSTFTISSYIVYKRYSKKWQRKK